MKTATANPETAGRKTQVEIKRNGQWEAFPIDFGYQHADAERYAIALESHGETARIVFTATLGNRYEYYSHQWYRFPGRS